MSEQIEADLLVIGWGKGGKTLAGARARQVARVVDGDAATTVEYSVDGAAASAAADLVLAATGRRPATTDLGLVRAGIEVGARGEVMVNELLQTSRPHVYAMGDVNGGPQFTYVSLDDYRVVLAHRWGDGSRSTRDRAAIPQVTFLSPRWPASG